MDSSTQELHYQRLSELIYDQEKTVTTLSAADDLKIPSIQAMDLLNMYLKDQRKLKPSELHATYLLCGSLNDEKGLGVYLVKEEDLQEKRILFKNIATEVVYSIQKGPQIEFNMIATINPINNDSAIIKSKNCVKRETLQQNKVPSSSNGQENNKENTKTNSDNKIVTKTGTSESTKEFSQQSQKQTKISKKGGITNFFSKAGPKISNTFDEKVNGKLQDSQPIVDNGNKVTEKVKNSSITNAEVENVPDNTIAERNTRSDDNSRNIEKTELKSKDKPKKKNVNNKKRKNEGKHDAPIKKRKRIQEVCDSDSSDIFDDDEAEDTRDIIEMSDEEPTAVIKPVLPPKNKKRKAVDKTFMDEEGFIVTSTEYIYESASEDEEKSKPQDKVEEKNKSPEAKSQKITSGLQAGNKGKNKKQQNNSKQPTLMSFFKKS